METQTISKTNTDLDIRSRSKHTPKPEDKTFGVARHATDEAIFNQVAKKVDEDFEKYWENLA